MNCFSRLLVLVLTCAGFYAHAQQPSTGFVRGIFSQRNEWAMFHRYSPVIQPSLLKVGDTTKHHIIIVETEASNSWDREGFKPLVSVAGGMQQSGAIGEAIAGVNYTGTIAHKLKVQAGYHVDVLRQPSYLQAYTDSTRMIAGSGYARKAGNLVYAHVPILRVGGNVGKYINLEAGNSRHFWGEGHRSLILGDAGMPLPYFRFTGTFSKFQLTGLWLRMRDISQGESLRNAKVKYAAMHSLEWNVSRRFRFALYEMVTWQARDTTSARTLELNYLNPLVFFRPVEYAQGSADNVLIGASFKWNPWGHMHVYGQMILDEFLLREVRANNGWWANKYGGQLGITWYNLVPYLHLQMEANVVRPFTYTHESVLQAWGQMNQPLAHPLGSNFAEGVFTLRYEREKMSVQEHTVAAFFGRDEMVRTGNTTTYANYGGNIFRSYRSPFQTFGNNLLQGDLHKMIFHELTVAYKFSENRQLEAFASHTFRLEKTSRGNMLNQFLWIGLRIPAFLHPVRDF
jgi:hypothetical protein